jgi:hypothetical protein
MLCRAEYFNVLIKLDGCFCLYGHYRLNFNTCSEKTPQVEADHQDSSALPRLLIHYPHLCDTSAPLVFGSQLNPESLPCFVPMPMLNLIC